MQANVQIKIEDIKKEDEHETTKQTKLNEAILSKSEPPADPPKKCNICSFRQPPPEKPLPIFHKHFSARELRLLSGVEKNGGLYFCPTCEDEGVPGKIHPANNTERIKICMSGSSLHKFWVGGGFKGDSNGHIDYCTIPGATIPMLEYAWRIDYRKEVRPMDVVVIAGLEDVETQTEDEILKRFEDFAYTVKAQSDEYHPESPSTFNVGTLIYPPKIAWLTGDGPIPYPEEQNKLEMITSINSRIIRFNDVNYKEQIDIYKKLTGGHVWPKSKAPKFHTYGLRKSTKRKANGVNIPHTQHRWEHWSKTEHKHMMYHLNETWRVKMGCAVGNFFKNQFDSPSLEMLECLKQVSEIEEKRKSPELEKESDENGIVLLHGRRRQ